MMIITISGEPGAGSTTISKMLAKELGLKLVTVGELHKKIAKEKGLTVEEHWKRIRQDKQKLKEFHQKLDELQKKEAEKGNVIINGKLSAFQIKNADLKILLTAELKERAKRVAKREKINVEEALKRIKEREEIERKEFKELYGIDYVKDKELYDMIIDTTKLTPEEITKVIKEVVNNAA